MLLISDLALSHFRQLLLSQEPDVQLRIYVTDAGTPRANCGISFCHLVDFKPLDIVLQFGDIFFRIDYCMKKYLEGAKIDVIMDGVNLRLTISAPNAKVSVVENKQFSVDSKILANDDSVLLENSVRNYIQSYINPQLSMHGGSVSLVKITEDFLVVLQFFGGCNGCAMASYTVKMGIEITLKREFPKLKGVVDITEHKSGDHSYFQ